MIPPRTHNIGMPTVYEPPLCWLTVVVCTHWRPSSCGHVYHFRLWPEPLLFAYSTRAVACVWKSMLSPSFAYSPRIEPLVLVNPSCYRRHRLLLVQFSSLCRSTLVCIFHRCISARASKAVFSPSFPYPTDSGYCSHIHFALSRFTLCWQKLLAIVASH